MHIKVENVEKVERTKLFEPESVLVVGILVVIVY